MDVQTEPFSVNGNMCNRGKEFAKQEIVNPQRTVTTVISAKKSGYSGIVPVRARDIIRRVYFPHNGRFRLNVRDNRPQPIK